LSQGYYEARDIYASLEIAWSLLRLFPQTMLKRIPEKDLKEFYNRDRGHLEDEGSSSSAAAAKKKEAAKSEGKGKDVKGKGKK